MNFRKIFEFWNTDFTDENDTQFIGTCPFCNKPKHFYVNKESGMYDCKVCTPMGGNVYTFLNQIYDNLIKNKDDNLLRSLARLKYVSYLKLKEWGIVPLHKNEYVIPYFNDAGKICNLKRYPLGRKGLFTPEIRAGIYGVQQLFDSEKRGFPIFVVEAEFNAITLDWFFQKIGFNAICIAIHGTYNKDLLDYLQGWNVYLCLDNDLEAKTQSIKLAEKLKDKANSINLLIWPPEFSKSYDIRDFIKDYVLLAKDMEGGKAKLFSLFREIKADTGEIQSKNIPTCSYEEVLDEFSKTVQLSPNFIIAFKLSLATVVSQSLPGKRPVWLFLVGPPGCGKSTICSAFRLANSHCIFQSSIHAKALVSGYSGRTGFDPSLIPKLNKKSLILQDFTEVLAKSQQEKGEIFSILRGVYDGNLQRAFGQGTIRDYYSSFSIVSGVTRAIYGENTAGLGERFIRFNMFSSPLEAFEQQTIALERDLEGDTCDLNVQKKVIGFLENKYDTSISNLKTYIPKWFIAKLQSLTTLVAILRTPVERHIFGRMANQVIYKPEPEKGNRLAVQFQRLALALCLIEYKPEIDEEIYNILKQVGRDSISDFVRMIIDELARRELAVSNGHILIKDIASGPILNSRMAANILQDLEAINVVTSEIKDMPGGIRQIGYKLTPEIQNFYTESDFGT